MTNSTPPPPVAVVGLGLLGGALARRLAGQGTDVSGFDVDPACRERLRSAGIGVRETLVAAVRDAKFVVLSLPDANVSGAVFRELLPVLIPGTVVIDTTTGDPGAMQSSAETAGAAGIGYLDGCVCGSSAQAERGEAVLVVGGDASTFAACEPILARLSPRVFHVGPAGAGARMKLVVNLVLGLNRAVLAEGLAFAERLGFDGLRALEVLEASPAQSAVMALKGRKMLADDGVPQARLRQHLKDVELILSESERTGAVAPLAERHRDILRACVAAGWGDLDNCVVLRFFRETAGTDGHKAPH